MTRRRRHGIAGIAVVVLLAAALVAGLTVSGSPVARTGPVAGDELPMALAGHLDKLRQAVPGNQGMAEEGPASGAEAAFLQRAYPANAISLSASGRRPCGVLARRRAGRSRAGRARRGPGSRSARARRSTRSEPCSATRSATSRRTTSPAAARRRSRSATRASPGNCELYITPRGRRRLADEERASPVSRTGSTSAGRSGSTRPASVTIDPNDPTGNTIYVGTGEANVCGSGCVAGVGIYKSTNGGDTWTGPARRQAAFDGTGVGAIAVKPGDPNTIYAATTTALRGMSSVCCSGVDAARCPGAPKWGLYKSTNGGATWTFIHNGAATPPPCTGDARGVATTAAPCSPRGVRHVVLDPSNPDIVYAGSYARGVWRSTDGGATWTQIKPSLERRGHRPRGPTIAVTTLAERQDADVRLRGQHRRARTAASLPQRRRRRPARRCSRT